MKTLRGTPTIDTSALDGLRLIFNCAIACYHALMWKVSFLTNHHENPAFQNLSNSNLIYILSNQGMSWVDLFFLLNSCLLVYHLLPRLEDSNSKDGVWKVIFEFYYKKWCSIVPIYTTSTLLVWLISISIHSSSGSNIYASHIGLVNGFVGGCPDRIWKNVLLINNWGPDIGCGGINWTIAPTILCYIIAPLLIIQCSPRNKNFRRRFLALALALFIGGLCINIYFSVANNIQYPMCTYPSFWKQGVSHFYVYASQYYIRSLPRIPVFVVGALCGLFLRTPAAITWVSSYRSLLGLVAVILLLLLYIHMCTWHSVYPTQPWSQWTSILVNVFLHSGSPFHAFTFAALILSLILKAPLFGYIVEILNRPLVRSLAVYSHGIHFFHFGGIFLSIEAVDYFQLVDTFKNDQTYWLSLIIFYAFVLIFTFALSAVYLHMVEPCVFGLCRGILTSASREHRREKIE